MVQEPQTSSGFWSPHPGFPWSLGAVKRGPGGQSSRPTALQIGNRCCFPHPPHTDLVEAWGPRKGLSALTPPPCPKEQARRPPHNRAHHVLKGPTIITDTARLEAPDTQLVTYRRQPGARCLSRRPYSKCEAGLFPKSTKCLSGQAQACKGPGNPQHALGCLSAQAPWAVQCR